MANVDIRVRKEPSDTRVYTFDMAYFAEIVAGQTLTISSYSATAGLTISSAAISGTQVQLTLTGGTDDSDYTVSVVLNLSGGGKLALAVLVQVRGV